MKNNIDEISKVVRSFILLSIFVPSSYLFAGTFQSVNPVASNWNSAATWTLTAGSDADGIPDADDDVLILSSYTVNVNAASFCNNLTMDGSLFFTSTSSLSVFGDLITYGGSYINGSSTGILSVAGNMIIDGGGTTDLGRVTINVKGNTALYGDLQFSSTSGSATFGKTLAENFTMYSSSAINFTAGQDVKINGDLITNGGCSLGGSATCTMNVSGNFMVNSGSITDIGRGNFTISGGTTISGALHFSYSATGGKSFNGGLMVNEDGSVDVLSTEDPQIAGDIIVDGTITASGGGSTWTMKGTSTGEAGAQSVQGKGSMNVTALSVNSSVAFLNSLSSFTVETLTGAGTFINDANANLYIKGNATISNLIATASLNTVSYSGTSTQVAKGTTYYSLVFNNTTITSPQITFNGNVNVIHDLTMTKGKINLAGYSFTLGIPGAESILSRAASTISNWFYGGTFTRCWLSGIAVTSTSGNCYGLFPVGEPAASTYSPLEINSTSNPVSDGKFSVLYSPVSGKGTDLDPVYNDGGKNIERILNSSFLTSAEGIDGGTYNISVSMTGVNSAGSIGDIRLAVYTGGTTAGVVGMHAAATGSVTKPTAKRTGLNMSDLAGKDFRIATIDKGATPLPVQFISFSAKQDGSRAELSWVTASELNSDHFLVQRSKNGVDFETIANVDAAGCSSVQKKYSILDYDPVEGVSYYRLKEVDYNGEFIFSGVAAVNFFLEKEISVYPDPADGWFSVSGLQLPALIQIFNLSGGKVLETTLREEQSVIHLNAEGGIYFLKATSGAKVFEKKIILK